MDSETIFPRPPFTAIRDLSAAICTVNRRVRLHLRQNLAFGLQKQKEFRFAMLARCDGNKKSRIELGIHQEDTEWEGHMCQPAM